MTLVDSPQKHHDLSPEHAENMSIGPRLDWRAILAGSVVSAAVFSLLANFGVAVGLSAVSGLSGKGLSATAVVVATGLWVLWITITSFTAGGYIAGRLACGYAGASEHENDVRSGVHGLLVWSIGTLAVAWIAASSITGAAKGAAVSAAPAAQLIQKLAESADPLAYAADRIGRSPAPGLAESDRGSAMRIFAASAVNGAMSADDKSFLAAQISARAGISQPDAAARVDEEMARLNTAVEKAKQIAESARKAGVFLAFLTAASLAIGAAAAWWAAARGGAHRDSRLDLNHLTAWR